MPAEAMPAELELLQSEIRNKRILAQVESNKELEKEVEERQKNFTTKKRVKLKKINKKAILACMTVK